jgi:hypothetical protein
MYSPRPFPGQSPGKFRVGQSVRLKHGFRGLNGEAIIAEVVEDRGPIGIGGRRLYAVKLRLDPWNELITERAEESLEAMPPGPDARTEPDATQPRG